MDGFDAIQPPSIYTLIQLMLALSEVAILIVPLTVAPEAGEVTIT